MAGNSNLELALPEDLRAFVDAEAAAGGYDSAGAFVQDVLRGLRNRKSAEARGRLEAQMLEALESGPGVEATPAFWVELKERVQRTSGASKP